MDSLTIARNDEEFVVLGDVMYLDVREGGHDLLLGRKLGALLEFEVSDSSRQSEVTVDAAEIHEASGGLNTRLLS